MAGESLLSLTTHWISADFEKVLAVLHVLTLEDSTQEFISVKSLQKCY